MTSGTQALTPEQAAESLAEFVRFAGGGDTLRTRLVKGWQNGHLWILCGPNATRRVVQRSAIMALVRRGLIERVEMKDGTATFRVVE